MKSSKKSFKGINNREFSFSTGLYYLTAPIPMPILNREFKRITALIAEKHPGLFDRLTGHFHKKFLIDPTNLPFVLELSPDPGKPQLKAFRRRDVGVADACISGSFLTLMGLIDGRLDADALFFTREIRVVGDTEAVVSLRNALDDIEGTIAQDVAEIFGPAGRVALAMTRKISDHVHSA